MGPVLLLIALTILNPIHGRSASRSSRYKSRTSESKSEESNSIDKSHICLTRGCLEASLTMMKNIDEEADPCDSFFKYACGNFEKRTIIPEDKSTVNQYNLIRDDVNAKLYYLMQYLPEEQKVGVFKNLLSYFERCTDQAAIEKNEISISKDLFKKLGDWPLFAKHEGKEWDDSDFDWREKTYLFTKMGLNGDVLIDVAVSTNIKNTKERVVEVDQPGLGISKEYIDKGPKSAVIKGYIKLMEDLMTLYLPGIDVKQEVKEIYEFEVEMSKIMLSSKDRRNATLLYNPMTVKEMNENFEVVNWSEYLNKMLHPEQIDDDETVIVNSPKYLSDLCKLLQDTEPRVLANVYFWRTLNLFSFYFPAKYKDARQKFTQVTTGKNVKAPRWKECIDLAASKFNIAIGSLYVRNHFKKQAKEDAMEMIETIRNEFRNIIMVMTWMDESTKKEAVIKLENMYPHIAYPDELLDDDLLSEYYEDLNMKVKLNSFLLTNLEISKFAHKKNVKKLRKPVDRKDWQTHGKAAVVNAFYSPVENTIQFPAGVFQGMFYAPDRPKYLNYGSIGFTIGHEITHGFDDRGRQFDKIGELRNWWDEATKEKFLQRAKCIIDQYTGFTVKIRSDEDRSKYVDKNLNGNYTQGENIADNGGLKIAYSAYDAWAQDNPIEESLPGFEKYTPQQMFWLSAANKWCSKSKPEILENMVLNDPHAPGQFRIDGPMMNIPEFSKDWKCKPGTKMNPHKKCSVWAEGIPIEQLRAVRDALR